MSSEEHESQKRLSVCLVVSGPNDRGGIERHVRDLAHGMAKRHNVHVLAHDSFRSMFDSSVQFHDLAFTSWRFDLLFLIHFASQIRSLNPNLIHVHGRKAARVVSMTRRFFDIPCILTVHNMRKDARLYRKFDSIIAVSELVAQGVEHPRVFTVLNGC